MTDQINRNLIVGVLALIALVSTLGIIYLSAAEKPITDSLISMASLTGGALAGALLPRSS